MTTGADRFHYHLGTWNLVLDVAFQNTEQSELVQVKFRAGSAESLNRATH